MSNVDIFCDGSCLDNGKRNARGGWSYVIPNNDKEIGEEVFGKLRAGKQTNNRAELEAMLRSLIYVYEKGDKDAFYTIYSDSEVVVGGINGTSVRNANRDIWEEIEEICSLLVGRFEVIHMCNDKSNHDDYLCAMNNVSDRLARQGAQSLVIAPTEEFHLNKEAI